ncbi:MAG: iron-sulfur cluster assembly protein [Candidatus Shapirobacteria bacterium]|jgi:metal-sulfur cluster biosynthetic enzyme
MPKNVETDLIDQTYDALKTVLDPEINVNIVDLGLVYDIKEKAGKVTIVYTLTSMGCPLAFEIESMVKDAVGKIKGVKSVKLKLVWDPPWDQSKMSPEAKAALDMDF